MLTLSLQASERLLYRIGRIKTEKNFHQYLHPVSNEEYWQLKKGNYQDAIKTIPSPNFAEICLNFREISDKLNLTTLPHATILLQEFIYSKNESEAIQKIEKYILKLLDLDEKYGRR